MRTLAAFAFVGAAISIVLFACSSDETGKSCSDGDRQQCSCASGATGTATCAGGTFGACVCESGTGSSSGGTGGQEGGAATVDAGFGNYLGACEKESDCPDGGTCFSFSVKGMFCTHACTANEQCAAPSPKCNPRGVCAIPDSTNNP